MIADRAVVGRADEIHEITGALDGVRSGGTALLLRGGAGIGKSVLLDAARDAANLRGFDVFAATGVETESGLPYSGLHRLLLPILGDIEALSQVQRRALRAALGLAGGPPGEPFLVSLAVLSILSSRAAENPVLITVDDVHWLDFASRTVMGIVGRRVKDHPIVLVAAIRDGYEQIVADLEIGQLPIESLDPDAAAEILDGRTSAIPPQVRDRLLAEAAGNPLALVELPATVRAAPEVEPSVLPISARLEAAFAGRLHDMPEATRTVLLVAAADETCNLEEILAASSMLGDKREREDLLPAAEAGLLRVEGSAVGYRHPLMRSAVYQAAPLKDRLAAHRALSQTLPHDLDRRTRHRAAATVTRDDDVASDVEAMARRAHARGAVLESAVSLARAARLTQSTGERIRRLLESGDLALEAGRPDLVRSAVEEVQGLSLDVRDQAHADLLAEGFDDGVTGDVPRVLTLVDEAREVAALGDKELALQLSLGAAVRCWWAALDVPVREQVLSAADEMQFEALDPRRLALVACASPFERGVEVVSLARDALAAANDDPLGRWFVAMAAHAVNGHELSLEILNDLAPQLRGSGSFGLLTQVLSMAQWDAAMLGDWATAEATAAEGDRLAKDTNQRIWGAGITCGLSAAAAVRGDAERAQTLAVAAEAVIVPHGLADMHSVLLAARGIAAVAANRHDDAFAVLSRTFDPSDPGYHYRERFGAIGYLAEAAVSSGRIDEGHAIVERAAASATSESAPGLKAAIAFARMLLTGHTAADEDSAAGLNGEDHLHRFHLGRLNLARGRRLIRERRRAEAQTMLEHARADFAAVEAPSWRYQADQALRQNGSSH